MIARLYTHPPGSLNGAAETYAKDVCDLGDGLVFSAVNSALTLLVVTKVTYDGEIAWQRSYASTTGGKMQPDGTGGFYLLGDGGSTPSLLHIDTNGALLWSRWSSYESGYDNWALSRFGSYDCLLSARSGVTTKLIAFAADGATLYEKIYTGITGEETMYSPPLSLASDGSGYMLASRLNAANDYLRVNKLSTTLSAVSLTKSYKIAASDSYWYLYDSCQLDGAMVLAFVVGSPAATLRLMCVNPDGTINWTKHLTDTGIADFDWNEAEVFGDTQGIFSTDEGFFVTSYDDADGAVLYRFNKTGALEWSKTIKVSNTAGNSAIETVIKLSDGRVVVSFHMQNATTGFRDASFLILNADGTPNSNFNSAVVEVAARTGVTVSAGTNPTVASDTAGSISTPTTTLVDSGVTLASTYYSLAAYDPDDFQTKQASGHKAIHHGQACSPYLQSGQATGTAETKHGIAMSVTRVPSGTTICASVGTKVVHHGQATGVSSLTSVATGHLATKHGTAQCKTIYAMTGALSIAHGTASFSSLFQATGYRATKHGIATTLLSRAMTGHLATKHGTMTSEWSFVSQLTGSAVTHHGTAGSKSSFLVTPSFKTRHGAHKTIRSITC